MLPARSEETGLLRRKGPSKADFKLESSYEGHTVNALVLTGDEGRDKLR
jgi:hypothetical protein